MKEVNWWKVALIIVAVLALFWGGFFIGRARDPEVIIKEKVEYVELPPVHDTLYRPKPYKVVEPVDSLNIIMEAKLSCLLAELFPDDAKKDTVYITKADTTAIMKDWASERRYKETLFDSDTLGRFTFDATVKYNRLANFDYTFVPMQKQTEITTKTTRKFLPYIGAGFDSGMGVLGQAGMFFHQDAGFAVQYRYDTQLKQSQFGGLFLYMF
jgi:hypothetical protein